MRLIDPLQQSVYSVDTKDGRYYQHRDTGQKLWSVTTVLGRYLEANNDGGLEAWKERVGQEEAEGIKVQAGKRGSALHDIAEKYLNGQDWKTGQMPINLMTFQKFKRELDDSVSSIIAIEHILWDHGELNVTEREFRTLADNTTSAGPVLRIHPDSEGLGFGKSGPGDIGGLRESSTPTNELAPKLPYNTAGRLDLLADYMGVRSIIDFKTARRRKRREHITGYYYQTEVYGQIANRLYNAGVRQTVVMIADDDSPKPQIFITPLGKYHEEVCKIFGDPAYNKPIGS